MENEKWVVGIGGSPEDTWDDYDNEEHAEEACLQMGFEVAFKQDINPDDVDIYHTDDKSGGACPDGSSGAYWPFFKRVN